MSTTKKYLGDGLYADYDGYHVVVTSEDGTEVPNDTIYLEPRGVLELIDYAAKKFNWEVTVKAPSPAPGLLS